MTDVTAPGGSEPIVVPVATPAESDRTPITMLEAAKQVSDWRVKQFEEQEAPEKPAASPPQESAQAENSDPQTEAPAETTEATEPAEVPPIEPPRSWTKEEKERFQSLPRETQEYLAQREQERDRDFRRSQNDAADRLKALTAKEQAAEQVRTQYEQALPNLLQVMQEAFQTDFQDVKSWADAEALAVTDPARAAQWQIRQGKLAQVAQELKATQDRQETEFATKWSDFTSKNIQTFFDKTPELATPEARGKFEKSAEKLLLDIGFSDQELSQAKNGKLGVSPLDSRFLTLLHDAARFRDAKAVKPASKPVPSVLKPGTPKAPQSANDAEIQDAEKRFEKSASRGDSRSFRDAAALIAARRASRA